METQTLTRRLSQLHASAVHDVLRQIGCKDFVLPTTIKPLESRQKLAGKIYTIEGEITTSHTPHETLIEWTSLLSKIPKNYVAVCQPNTSEVALMGELSAETLQKRGIIGYLVDGGCRDVSIIKGLNFNVFCSFNTPKDVVGRWIPTKLGAPIIIGDCTIRKDDYLLADLDGAVVIPHEHAEETITQAELVMTTENAVRKAIMDGIDPKEAYLKFGKF
ncbi:RraA family protein [Burkholderiales bacterium]|nr:RraA family protein [Burkholderiales bacterium]